MLPSVVWCNGVHKPLWEWSEAFGLIVDEWVHVDTDIALLEVKDHDHVILCAMQCSPIWN
jgi:hypothetical protein